MKTFVLFFFYIFFTCDLLFCQQIYVGSYNPKSSDKFQLISAKDTFEVISGKKEVKIFNLDNKDICISKSKRNNYLLKINDETIRLNETKNGLKFSSGLKLNFNDRSSKKLILADSEGKIVLEAMNKFKYPVSQYRIIVNDDAKSIEILSYALIYLCQRSKKLKSSVDSQYYHHTY